MWFPDESLPFTLAVHSTVAANPQARVGKPWLIEAIVPSALRTDIANLQYRRPQHQHRLC